MKSYAPEVIADPSGKWCGNSLRFATKQEAEENVYDLSMRWYAVRKTRVVESDEPVNYTYHDRKLRQVVEVPEGITVSPDKPMGDKEIKSTFSIPVKK